MHTLALSVTNRCPLRCDFCCVPPGPGDLDNHSIARTIDHVLAEKHRWRAVGFTGGEPLLRVSEICEAGKKLESDSIPWGITTGLGWCSNEARAKRVAESLIDAGLSSANISFDPSHLSHLKTSAYRCFLAILHKARVRLTISCTLFTGQEMADEELLEKTGLVGSNVPIERHYVAKVGYAAERSDCTGGRFDFAHSKCPMQGGLTLSVWPDGDVYPCCSTYVVNKEKGLVIGNIKNESINSILTRAESDAYVNTIRTVGFSGLVASFHKNIGSIKDIFSEPPQDVCHLCARVSAHSDLKALRSEIIHASFKHYRKGYEIQKDTA